MKFLKDFYNFENIDQDGNLRLSRLEAVDLVELESVMKALELRWFGGEKMRKLGQKLKDFKGEVPKTMKEMITIPGAARKTANVVLGIGFGINEGIAVDTHVTRLAQRLGLSRNNTPEKIEQDLMKLFSGKKLFDTPKPIALIKEILKLGANTDSIILDFFSGSGTTGHAVMEMNSEDGGTRSWIQVQLPEPTPDDSAARAEGFATISELARKRLELAADAISSQDSDLFSNSEGPLDLGYRAYSLVDSHFSKWHLNSEISPTLLEQHLLDLRDDNSKTTNADELITEILLKQGYSLSENIGDIEVAGLRIKTIGENVVYALLDKDTKPSLEQIRKVLEKKPVRFIILEDTLAADDELKTNLVQECKSRNIELWTV